jgi:hypothetical protein
MAKNFPYFKFIVSEWMTGDIVFESLSAQGLFINICALYWQRDGNLSIEDVNKRYKNPPELDDLIGNFIIIEDDLIAIKFLDEQLIDAGHVSKINSDKGKKSAEIRALKKQLELTVVQPQLTDVQPILTNKNKRRIKEEEEENKININFDVFWNLYNHKVAKPKCVKKWKMLKDEQRQKIIDTLPNFLKGIKDKQFQPHPYTYLNNERWEDELSVALTESSFERVKRMGTM